METHVTLAVAVDGSCECRFQRPGRLRRLFVVSPAGTIVDAIFNLAVQRGERVVGTVEGAHVQGFPLRLTVAWDAGDLVSIRFNPEVVGSDAKAVLVVAFTDNSGA